MFSLPEGRPALMGILNLTPDSFSDGGRYPDLESAVGAGLSMMEAGADLIDVGGESTRPGAEAVSAEEELRRTMRVVERLAADAVPVSIDTRKPLIARAALQAGAVVVNDVGGFRDPEMIAACAETDCSVCVMHMRGDPTTMQSDPRYENVAEEVLAWLLQQAKLCQEGGISKNRIWIDPGFGFGKTVEHNLVLLASLRGFVESGYPVLAGLSRKSFIGKVGSSAAPLEIKDRLAGTLAAQTLAQASGVKIIRTHDVREAKWAADLAAEVLRLASSSSARS